jgi:hypothetical protein
MTLATWLSLFSKDALYVIALILLVLVILKKQAEIRKIRADARQTEAKTLKLKQEELKVAHDRIEACTRNILASTSAMVDELDVVFGFFAFAPEKYSRTKLRERLEAARKYRREQKYRGDIEMFVGELEQLAQGRDPAVDQLRLEAEILLAKVAEKKEHVRRIEEAGLNRAIAEDVKNWLGSVREFQLGLRRIVGSISGRLGLEEDRIGAMAA